MAQAACLQSLVTICTSGPHLCVYLRCLLPKAICLSAHDLRQDRLLFHVPDGPCTRVCTPRAEAASSLSPSLSRVLWIACVFTGWEEEEEEEEHGTPSDPEVFLVAPCLPALEEPWSGLGGGCCGCQKWAFFVRAASQGASKGNLHQLLHTGRCYLRVLRGNPPTHIRVTDR